MQVMILEQTDDLAQLLPLLAEWKESSYSDQFEMPLDVDIAMKTIRNLVCSCIDEFMVVVDDVGKIHGFMGALFRQSHVGPSYIAHECLFYVSAESRGCRASLLRAFRRLGRMRGCTHYILNSSRIAGDADESGRLFTAFGAKPFETSYVGRL